MIESWFLVPALPKNARGRAGQERSSRVQRFVTWLRETERAVECPDLAAYRDYLIQERRLSESSVKAHLATIRARYRELLKSGAIRQILAEAITWDANYANADLDDLLDRLSEALSAKPSDKGTVAAQEAKALVLSPAQAHLLLRQPRQETLAGVRDTALLAVMLSTGLREQEVSALEVHHLYAWCVEEMRPALYVPGGPGCVERCVPYLVDIVLAMVEQWRHAAEIEHGPVFRAFYVGEKIRPTPLSRRALEQVLASYPIEIDGQLTAVRPLDLRRTYARLLYDEGYDFFTIQRYLGVRQANTVASYLAGERQPQGVDLEHIFDLPAPPEPFWMLKETRR